MPRIYILYKWHIEGAVLHVKPPHE